MGQIQHKVREKYQKVYQAALERCNPRQRQAADQIHGPVMVIAGPGTGKTQILAVRIGRILQETDTQAHNILCLTYTDAATISMRNRLVKIIGPDAHRIHIYTFHSFCNQVIQDHLGYFGDYRQLEAISDLEKVELFDQLVTDLPVDHRLKKLKGDPYRNTQRRLENLFALMKKENYSPEYICEVSNNRIEEIPTLEEYKYQNNRAGQWQKGDIKQKQVDQAIAKLEDLKAGAQLFPMYKKMMTDIGLYDYDDMILWVLDAFKKDENLLLEYQERYEYFLVDEFQDTNGSQKQLLDLLISYWSDNPNVFVVGDDDQAIYKFQGANLGNITDFEEQYHPTPVVLVDNYRSTQKILDGAMALINYNQERIVNNEHLQLDKDLVAHAGLGSAAADITISSYPNQSHEQAAILDLLESKYEKNGDISDIAVIYRSHKQVEKLVEVLEKKNIPINVKRRVNILHLPLVKNILNILTYLDQLYHGKKPDHRLLFELMHYSFFSIRPQDVSKLLWYTRGANEEDSAYKSLSQVIADPAELEKAGLTAPREVTAFSDLINKWLADLHDVTLQVLFQNIINEGMILSQILFDADKGWKLQVISTLFDYIKNETAKNPDVTLSDILRTFRLMNENKIALSINKVIASDKGAHFITAHSSKGLEFEEVVIYGCTKDIWDKNAANRYSFSYPTPINADNDTNVEDERRLMYVAMTRAKKTLTISYSLKRVDSKELAPSQFIDQLIGATDLSVSPRIMSNDKVLDFEYHVLLKESKPNHLIDHDLINKVLEGYRLSVTGLNKYLKCPYSFYFESILRVPMARTHHMGYGRAIHYALEKYYAVLSMDQKPSVDDLLKYFRKGMDSHKGHFSDDQYTNMSALGKTVLTAYYKKYLQDLDADTYSFHLEVPIKEAEYKGVPIKGFLDKVTVPKGSSIVEVVDYKTGTYKKPKLSPSTDRQPEGGDYWRQIVFYKMLLQSDRKYNWDMGQGVIDYVEPDKKTGDFSRVALEVSPAHIEKVGEQMLQVWQDIHDHKFDKGCGEDDCHWCQFIANDYVIDPELAEIEDIEPEDI